MTAGDAVKHKRVSFRDAYTGVRVTRLTSPGVLAHHPYFYYNMFTGDSRTLIHAAEVVGEGRQLFRMDVETGVSQQLTEGGGIHDFSCSLSSDDRRLFYCRDRQAVELDLASGKERTIYETPPGWVSNANPGFSADDRLLVLVEMKADDVVPSRGDWSTFGRQWEAKPHCRIVMVDIASGEARVVLEEPNCWLGHPQFRPGDNDTVSFCHEGPWHCIDARMWLVRSDGSGHRCARPHAGLELVTHEYWLADGSKLAFVHRTGDEGQATIRFLDPEGLEEEVLMPCSRYCHFISNRSNTLIVGDGQPKDEHFLYLVNVSERTEEKLCSHGTTWKTYGNTQDAHPHPSFTPNDRQVVFTSDMGGLPSIYLVDLPWR